MNNRHVRNHLVNPSLNRGVDYFLLNYYYCGFNGWERDSNTSVYFSENSSTNCLEFYIIFKFHRLQNNNNQSKISPVYCKGSKKVTHLISCPFHLLKTFLRNDLYT